MLSLTHTQNTKRAFNKTHTRLSPQSLGVGIGFYAFNEPLKLAAERQKRRQAQEAETAAAAAAAGGGDDSLSR